MALGRGLGRRELGREIYALPSPPYTLDFRTPLSRIPYLQVWFFTLHRFERDTRLRPLIIKFRYIYSLLVICPGRLIFCPLNHSSTLSSSVSASTSADFLAFARLMSACSHRCIRTYAPGALYSPSQRYSSDCVALYCKTMFCRYQMYYSIVWNPASSFFFAVKVYSRLPLFFRRRSRPVSHHTTWSWNPPRIFPCRG